MTGSRTQGQVLWTALRRFGAIAILVAVVAGVLLTWLVQAVSKPTYTAEGTFVVPIFTPPRPGDLPLPGAPDRPTSPGDAQSFARNYSVVVAQDQKLLAALEPATRMSQTDLTRAISAVSLPNSAAIRVTFTADTRQSVRAYFDTMRDIVGSTTSPTTNLPAGNLAVLRQPDTITAQRGLDPVAPYLGVVVGLLLGVSAAVLLERLNPQVRSADDLRAMVAWPVLELSEHAPDGRYESIVLRALDGRPEVRSAAVTCVAGVSQQFTEVLGARLEQAEAALRLSGRLPGAGQPIRWEALGQLPGVLAERRAQDADAVVLAVPHRARLGATTKALQRLEDLAVEDVVLVLGTRARATSVPRDSAGAADGGAGPRDPGGATARSAADRVGDGAVARSR